MAETTTSDTRVVITPTDAQQVASSHDDRSHENESGGTSVAAAPYRFCFRLCMFIFNAVLQLIILLVQFIWYLYWLLSQLMFIEDVSLPVRVPEHLDPKSGDTSVDFLIKGIDNLVNERKATAKWRVRILLLLLLSLVIVVSVPGLKLIKVLGLPLWKWMVMVALVILSYHYISLLGKRIVKILDEKLKEDKYDVVYYADGLRRSVNNVIFCVLILLAWELFFRSSRHGLRRYGVSEKALDIGTWSAVSLLVFAFLLLAKNTLILSWESRVIYRQFTDNIGKAGLQLYFLGLVSGEKFDIFSPKKEGGGKGEGEAMNIPAAEEKNGKQGGGNEKENEVPGKTGSPVPSKKAQKFRSRNWKLDRASTNRKKKMAKYFIKAARLLSRKDDNVPEDIRKQWQRFRKQGDPDYITNERVKDCIKNYKTENEKVPENKISEEIDSLFEEFKSIEESKGKERKNADESKGKGGKNADEPNEESKDKEPKISEEIESLSEEFKSIEESKGKERKNADESKGKGVKNADEPNEESKDKEPKIHYTTFEEWMEKAFKNCLSLGYTLKDAEGVVDNLNNIMRVFLSIVVFLCWLLLTSIVSTKALITIASPFIAITFIFGDTLKAVFEGIIFTFVTHPFIVGDLCIIDDTQLEVKQMDVLKTTFHKVNTEDQVLYPNKVLAKKAIFNLKGNTDGRDCVQLSLDKSVDINSLEEEIKKFFRANKDKFNEDSVMMMMEDIGETIKIAINFNHIMRVQDDTHGQCFKKKKEQRSDLLKAVFKQVQTKQSSPAENIPNSSGSKLAKLHSI